MYYLEQYCKRLQEGGIHLKEERYQEQVEYLGYLIDAMGIHPTTEKVRAIKEAPTPNNITTKLVPVLTNLPYETRLREPGIYSSKTTWKHDCSAPDKSTPVSR